MKIKPRSPNAFEYFTDQSMSLNRARKQSYSTKNMKDSRLCSWLKHKFSQKIYQSVIHIISNCKLSHVFFKQVRQYNLQWGKRLRTRYPTQLLELLRIYLFITGCFKLAVKTFHEYRFYSYWATSFNHSIDIAETWNQ